MIEITTIATGSTGNNYRVADGPNTLMIDCGINFRRIQEGFDFKLSSVAGCLVSHSHKDHCVSAHDMVKAGVDVWVSKQTQAEIPGLSGHHVKNFEPKKQFSVGVFTVLPFPLQHDVENHGFLIQSKSGKVLYITDTYYCRFTFKGVTHFMVECNYLESLLEKNIDRGVIPRSHANRVKKSHFGLKNLKGFFDKNDTSKCREIHLIHGSNTNLDKEQAVNEIQKLTGCPVYCP